VANKLNLFENIEKLKLAKKKNKDDDTLDVGGIVGEEIIMASSQTDQLNAKTNGSLHTPNEDHSVHLTPSEVVTPVSKEPTKEEVEKKLDAMIESYERNKLLSIDDIYRKSSLVQDIKTTVFMVDVYAKALPENLPLDIKRESVLNIMKASEIKVDDLLSDAYKRIDSLNNVLESVVQSTEDLKVKNSASIRDLEKRIEELKRTVIEREKFQETQNTMIEYEIQRIINIVDFVKPK
jgi:hypothetical protein